ncbi:hypothetical protein KEM55_005541 [Ascosphaera atra]|nr:hypothetical protein KEM55_005541 [Ascosphaera atra]
MNNFDKRVMNGAELARMRSRMHRRSSFFWDEPEDTFSPRMGDPLASQENPGNGNTNYNNCTFYGHDGRHESRGERGLSASREPFNPLCGPPAYSSDIMGPFGEPFFQERYYYPPSGYDYNGKGFLPGAGLPPLPQAKGRPFKDRILEEEARWRLNDRKQRNRLQTLDI